MLRAALSPDFCVNFRMIGLRNYGVFGHGMAHTDTGVEGSSLPPNVPQGMDTGAELLAGHARQATEREYSKNSGRAKLGYVWHDSGSASIAYVMKLLATRLRLPTHEAAFRNRIGRLEIRFVLALSVLWCMAAVAIYLTRPRMNFYRF